LPWSTCAITAQLRTGASISNNAPSLVSRPRALSAIVGAGAAAKPRLTSRGTSGAPADSAAPFLLALRKSRAPRAAAALSPPEKQWRPWLRLSERVIMQRLNEARTPSLIMARLTHGEIESSPSLLRGFPLLPLPLNSIHVMPSHACSNPFTIPVERRQRRCRCGARLGQRLPFPSLRPTRDRDVD